MMSKTRSLIEAIRTSNHPDMLKLLKEMTTEEVNAQYVDPAYTSAGTALHAACLANNTTALVALLRIECINVNPIFTPKINFVWCQYNLSHNYLGFTPIMMAATLKYKSFFGILVQHDGVDLKAVSVRNGEEFGLPEIMTVEAEANNYMLLKMLAIVRRKKSIAISNIEVVKTTELEVLKDLSTNFKELLESSEMSDFKIICGGEVFPCHKNILLARSNVLRSMVNNDMKESNQGHMTISDLEPAIVKIVLKFIYTGEVVFDDIAANAAKLLEVADRYELKGLIKLCEDQLISTVNNNNVLELIVKADLYHADILRKVAMKWIVENRFEIVKQEDWKDVLIKFPNLLMDVVDALTTKS